MCTTYQYCVVLEGKSKIRFLDTVANSAIDPVSSADFQSQSSALSASELIGCSCECLSCTPVFCAFKLVYSIFSERNTVLPTLSYSNGQKIVSLISALSPEIQMGHH